MYEKHDEDWFLERIGEVVFRKVDCYCKKCIEIYKNGELIKNEKEARYMYKWQYQAATLFYSMESMYEDPEPMKTKWNKIN